MRYFTILFLAALFFSCADNNTNTNSTVTTTKQIIPLRVGNYWKFISKNDSNGYDTVFISPTGKIVNGNSTYYNLNILYTKVKTLDSNYSAYCFTGSGDNYLKYLYVTNSDEGYLIGELQDASKLSTLTPSILWLYPAKTNDVYLAKFDLGSTKATSVKVFDTEATVTVPAGTFKCIKYGFDSKGRSTGVYDFFIYFAPGVGPIRLEDSSGKNWGDLESYKVDG